jgi:tetrahydromethanopterin S-methyltransferase subunit G
MVASVAVMAREAWTDERLDDLKENVNQRFDDVDNRLDKLEAEVSTGFAEVNARFDALQRTLFIGVCTMSASIFGALIIT